MRVLLVEDEAILGAAVRDHIAAAGHAVDWMQNLADAELSLRSVDYGLVLLDLALPDGSGLDLLRNLRRRNDRRPVIILTARDRISDRIDGLNAGADDYLVKPFDLDELTARIGAVARRANDNVSPVLPVGELEIAQTIRQVSRRGERIELTRREWAILDELLRRPGAIVSRERLEEGLYAFGSEIESNAVEVYVSRLRKKLGKDVIHTQRGLGYRLALGQRP
ncbi:winged helix family two component transcriptional regulator [Dongia mobilis]|uniref:Winged helix family two component transcriptional regulator n=1 Tax=Dongia mobilis TaxID=578943 RepID=A0A4R6WR58_9PROT|nr:response regulator transcription factor [Dongia mobilis]TDQ84065.1 winged helix family two component transcriptional regulator [Dongia mobilis]